MPTNAVDTPPDGATVCWPDTTSAWPAVIVADAVRVTSRPGLKRGV